MNGAGQQKGRTLIDNQTRRLLIRLARSSRSRTSDFIAARLEQGEHVEVIELNKPKGRLGYVMLIDLGRDVPRLYVKLQLGAGVVIGRSFHYSDHD